MILNKISLKVIFILYQPISRLYTRHSSNVTYLYRMMVLLPGGAFSAAFNCVTRVPQIRLMFEKKTTKIVFLTFFTGFNL